MSKHEEMAREKHKKLAIEYLKEHALDGYSAGYYYRVLVGFAAVIEQETEARVLENAARVCEEQDCDQTEYRCQTMERAAAAIRNLSPKNLPTSPKSVVPEGWKEMLDFLCGAGPLEGAWFGEKHPTEYGAFWWRRRLRALAAPDTDLSVSGEVIGAPMRHLTEREQKVMDRALRASVKIVEPNDEGTP